LGPSGKVIGIDLGEKRVGVAISDELRFAHPLCVIIWQNLDKTMDTLMSLAKENEAESFVVGLPRNMDGTMGKGAKQAVRFARRLHAKSNLPVALCDERLTTSQAEKEMIGLGKSRRRRRMTIDEAAAVLILESYMTSVAAATKGKDEGL
jgi:putative Holliday junction resolvase